MTLSIEDCREMQAKVVMPILFSDEISHRLFLNSKFANGVVELSVETNAAICSGKSLNLKARKDGYSPVYYLAGWDLKNHPASATFLDACDLSPFYANIVNAIKIFGIARTLYMHFEETMAGCSEDEAFCYKVSVEHGELVIRTVDAETSEQTDRAVFTTKSRAGLDLSEDYFGFSKDIAFTKVGDYTVFQHICDALSQHIV